VFKSQNLRFTFRCYYISIPTLFTFNAATFFILCVSIDRFCLIWFPVWYQNHNQGLAYGSIWSSWGFGVMIVALGFVYRDSDIMVPGCALPTALNGFAFTFWNLSNTVIVVLVIAVYILTYVKYWMKSKAETTSTTHYLLENSTNLCFAYL